MAPGDVHHHDSVNNDGDVTGRNRNNNNHQNKKIYICRYFSGREPLLSRPGVQAVPKYKFDYSRFTV